MKIAINGDIIDTENIYKITKIKRNNLDINQEWCHTFEIQLFNNKIIEIIDQFPQKYLHNKLENQNIYDKISNFRDGIIKIWSENQSDIPQFNL